MVYNVLASALFGGYTMQWGAQRKTSADRSSRDFESGLFFRIFSVCAPSLVGACYLQSPDARATFLHKNLLWKSTCSITGGRITYWGHKRKKIIFFIIKSIFSRGFPAIEASQKSFLRVFILVCHLLVRKINPFYLKNKQTQIHYIRIAEMRSLPFGHHRVRCVFTQL